MRRRWRPPDAQGGRIVYLTPAGRLLTQKVAEELAREPALTLLCGRYEGIDQRVIDAFVTDEISVGDYVFSGGEVAAMAVVDSLARLVPGVITGESLEEESFSAGLLEYPALHAARGISRHARAGNPALGAS